MNAPRWAASALTLLSLSACRSTSTVVVSTTASQANVPTPSSDALPGNSRFGWTVETREHVDLWLHAFALLRPDSSLVPTFALGYADEVQRANLARYAEPRYLHQSFARSASGQILRATKQSDRRRSWR